MFERTEIILRNLSPAGGHAAARSAAYGLFSQLVASPFEAPSLVEALPPEDLEELADALRAQLPYDFDLGPLALVAAELHGTDAERLAEEYSGLFEVGSSGARMPLREELADASQAQAKEETLRFYDFFGYTLAEERQWAPDHLSIQLEFMHFLSFKESEEVHPEKPASYRLAQRDFLERHLYNWFPEILGGVRRHGRGAYWIAVFQALGLFLPADAAWLRETVTEARPGSDLSDLSDASDKSDLSDA